MQYAKVNKTVVIKYPYTMADLQNENVSTSYDGRFSLADWYNKTNEATTGGFRLVEVTEIPKPATNELETISEGVPVFSTADTFKQVWVVAEKYATLSEKTAAIAASLISTKDSLSKQIDAAVLAIYDKPMQLSKEYEAREKAAVDYKAAGYPAIVPEWISDFATPAGLTATVATDLILTQAAQLRSALQPLGKLRMRKFEVQRATTEVGARASHTAVMAAIAVIAAGLV